MKNISLSGVFIFLALLTTVFVTLDRNLSKFYIFSPQKLQQISREVLAETKGRPSAVMIDRLNVRLKEEYGDHVQWQNETRWFFNNAGGAMGSMFILHSSFTEYLIIFGTPLGTEGHTGIHFADDYFTILRGEQRAFGPGDLEPTVYKPGDQHWLKRGDGKQYLMPQVSGGCWALELAQGWIPSMLPFGFADTFSSTLDWGNLYTTVVETGLAMGRSAMRLKF